MDYYKIAEEPLRAATLLKNDGLYRMSVSIKLSRKYFNDSRYANNENFSTFTKDLAVDFIKYAQQVKDYVDTDCQSTLEDLQKRFDKPNS